MNAYDFIPNAYGYILASILLAATLIAGVSVMLRSPLAEILSAVIAGLLVNPVFVLGGTMPLIPGWAFILARDPVGILYGLVGGIPWAFAGFLLSGFISSRVDSRRRNH